MTLSRYVRFVPCSINRERGRFVEDSPVPADYLGQILGSTNSSHARPPAMQGHQQSHCRPPPIRKDEGEFLDSRDSNSEMVRSGGGRVADDRRVRFALRFSTNEYVWPIWFDDCC